MLQLITLFAAVWMTNSVEFTFFKSNPVNLGKDFVFTGTVAVPPSSDAFVILDDQNQTVFFNRPEFVPDFAVGDRIRISGSIVRWIATKSTGAICKTAEVLSHGEPPVAAAVAPNDLKSGQYDNRLVVIRGIVEECFDDDTDSDWIYLTLDCEGETCFIASPHSHVTAEHHRASLQDLIGAKIAVRGVYSPLLGNTSRWLMDKMVVTFVDVNSVERLVGSPDNPFDVPTIGSETISSLGDLTNFRRGKMSGHVLAVWSKNRLVLKTFDGGIHNINLAGGIPPPCHTLIETVGNIETDLYRINLSNAIWRKTDGPSVQDLPTENITATDIFNSESQHWALDTSYHGKQVKLSGLVQDISRTRDGETSIQLKCKDHTFSVITRDTGEIRIGCTIEATGICVVESPVWHQHAAFPRITGITLVTTDDESIHILAQPAWWTASRLLLVIGLLLAAIAAILVWNLSLRRVAERRSQLYLKAKLARIRTELKVGERTRLSVELHDTLSQNLIGASMEINAAEETIQENKIRALEHLHIASKTLKRCRDELRNCLWDLRGRALEESDMNAAIRKTLEPYIADIDVQIRFNVPRNLLTDNTAHALMRIIRELVLNGIRHGKATSVKIAGSREYHSLRFSVRDNGQGFDPLTAPGIDQGHFGLQGVRERLRHLKGSITIESRRGHGTKVMAQIELPDEECEKA